MKKILIILSLVLATALSASAQRVYALVPSGMSNTEYASSFSKPSGESISEYDIALKNNKVLPDYLLENQKRATKWFVFSTVASIGSAAGAIAISRENPDPSVIYALYGVSTVSSIVAGINLMKWVAISQDRKAFEVQIGINKVALTF